mgnify:FL=1
MEGKDWYSRTGDRDHDNRFRGENRPVDEDMYRGAYRFDISSDHRNVSTWDWDRNQGHGRGRNDYNQNYNRDYNRNYNQDYNRDYSHGRHHTDRHGHERIRSGQHDRGYDPDNYNTDSRYRDDAHPYRTSNSSDWGRHSEEDRHHRSVRSRIDEGDHDRSIFDGNYGPDHYGRGGGENYGNMAGSLSYGYDGTTTYDPDWDRRYEPLTGHRQSYHGHYTSRHPEPDRDSMRRR